MHIADPKSGASRSAYMTQTIKKVFENKKSGKPEEWVFKDKEGKKFSEISRTFESVVLELGLNKGIEDPRQKVCFHTLRHTFASWLAIKGTPILTIKELLGHKTLIMTIRYAHLIPDQKRAAIEGIEEALNNIQGKDKKEDP